MKNSFLFLFGIFLTQCGLPGLDYQPLSENQPYVQSVTPASGSAVTGLSRVDLSFSKPLWADTVTQDAVFLIKKAVYDTYDEDDWDELSDDVRNGAVEYIAGDIALLDENQTISYQPQAEMAVDTEYLIVVLPKVQSQDYFPLNQTVAGYVQRQFKSSFVLVGEEETEVEIETIAETQTQAEVSGTATEEDVAISTIEVETEIEIEAETIETVEANTTTVTEVSPPVEETPTQIEVTVETTVPVVEEIEEELPGFDWERLLITEVVTDPQQDHNESSSGNGIAFDATSGSGTIGSTDEYIELFNGTEQSLDLTQYSLLMSDGSDVTQSLNSGWNQFFSLGGNVENFQAGEYVVLGNPDGDMKNTVHVLLYDESQQLVDDVDIADSNADDIFDESYQRNELGDFEAGQATPGF